MQLVFDSKPNGWTETAEVVYVYELDNDDEFWKLEEMTHEEKCEFMNVFDETGYFVQPGATYFTYDFHVTLSHFIMIEHISINC